MPFSRIGWVNFAVEGAEQRLAVYWLNEYSGGIFIPFRDATSGKETYGSGRYLWDSAKGADLEIMIETRDGRHAEEIVDFALVPVGAGEDRGDARGVVSGVGFQPQPAVVGQ